MCVARPRSSDDTRQKNMPLFQKWCPDFAYSRAIGSLGFSRKRSTRIGCPASGGPSLVGDGATSM